MTSRLEVQEPDQHATYVATPIPGVFIFYPTVHADQRGSFHEWYKADDFAEALGYPFFPEQANMSVSARGVVRGIHLAEVPPGQAKMVTCPAGALSDIIVDLRKGSSTYGKHIVVPLNRIPPLALIASRFSTPTSPQIRTPPQSTRFFQRRIASLLCLPTLTTGFPPGRTVNISRTNYVTGGH